MPNTKRAIYFAEENAAADAMGFVKHAQSAPSLATASPSQAAMVGRHAESFVVGDATVQDYVLSPDGGTMYVAGSDGIVRAYDMATRAQTGAWHVGSDLGGIDITPDGKSLLVVEDSLVYYASNSFPTATSVHQIYRVDLASGEVSALARTSREYYFDGILDVAATSDGKAIVSGDNQWGTIDSFDLATGAFTQGNTSVFPSTLRADADHGRIVVLPNGISDAPVYMYTAGSGITASHGSYQDNVGGYNDGVVAIANDSGFVAQGLGSVINIYNGNLAFQFDLNRYKSLGIGNVSGLAFSDNGRTLFILDSSRDLIVAVNTQVWEMVTTYRLGDTEIVENYYGNGLVASADGSFLTFVASDGIHVVDITKGGQTYAGTAGADTLAGGAGNDIYLVNARGDVVTENIDAGYDIVRASLSHRLEANVEQLDLTGAATRGWGNALANVIVGNELDNLLISGSGNDSLAGGAGADTLSGGRGNDVLDGGVGIDRLIGGAGDDRYIVGDSDDVIVERANGGVDTVEAGVSFALGSNVEKLLLTGTGDISGTGNTGDNHIIGNIGDNALSGGDGADRLEAGGGGLDRMTGGAGADTFVFVQLDSSGASYALADSIADFVHDQGDRIDLSGFDADVLTPGDQAFTFIGNKSFSETAGELQVIRYSGDTFVQADVNGDGLIDFVVKLDGVVRLSAADFVL